MVKSSEYKEEAPANASCNAGVSSTCNVSKADNLDRRTKSARDDDADAAELDAEGPLAQGDQQGDEDEADDIDRMDMEDDEESGTHI